MLNIRKRQIRRYLAALLSAAMVISNTAPAFAVSSAAEAVQEENAGKNNSAEEKLTITDFEQLEENISLQALEKDDGETDINFPTALTANAVNSTFYQNASGDKASASNASPSNASSSNALVSENMSEDNADGAILNDSDLVLDAEVACWVLDPRDSSGSTFDGKEGTVWYYDPVLTGYDEEGRPVELADDVQLPYITVTVGEVTGSVKRGKVRNHELKLKNALLNAPADIVENDVFISMEAVDGRISARTGETLSADVYAYNDNPNAEATAQIRIYADFGTREKAELVGSEDGKDLEDITLEITDLNGTNYEQGGTATTVRIAKWTEPDEDGVRILEFELPSGAAVGFTFDMCSKVGYDHTIDVKLSSEYRIADDSGEFPDEWESADSLILTWLGKFSWGGFEKSADPETFDYVSGKFSGDAVIHYSFAAVNEAGLYNPEGPDYGPVYTEKVVLKDEITLPAGMIFPAGMTVSEDGKSITLADGTTPVISLTGLEDSDDYTLEATASDASPSDAADNETCAFILTIINQDPENTPANWNPLENGKLGADLSLSALTVGAASVDWTDAKIRNDADFTAYSVLQNEGTDEEKQETYHETGSAETVLKVTDGILFDKEIAKVVKKNSGIVTEYYHDGTNNTPEIEDGDTVWYTVSLTNQSFYTRKINFTDQLPQVLHLEETSIVVNNERKDFTTVVRESGTGYTLRNLGGISPGSETSPIKYLFEINDVLPGETVYVHYACSIDFSKMDTNWTPEKEGFVRIENIASFNNQQEKAVVRTPKDKGLTLKKEIVSRKGITRTAKTWEIHANFDKDGNITGYSPSGAYTEQFGSRANLGWDKLVREFNAGDYIEYMITLDNDTFGDIYGGVLQDVAPFMRNMYTTQSGGWQVYAYGMEENYMVSGYTSDDSTVGVYCQWSRRNSRSESYYTDYNYYEAFSSSVPHYDEIVKASCGSGSSLYANNMSFGANDTTFSFSSSHPIKAKTKYRQSITVRAPGFNSYPPEQWKNENSGNSINKGFHHLVTAYRYDTGMTSPADSNYFSGRSELEAFAFWSGANGPGISTSSVTTPRIDHAVAGELFVSAGIAAQAVVKDPANIGPDELCIHVEESRTDEDSNKFAPVPGQVVVGSVTVFNMTSDKMESLSTHGLSVFLPQGFEWLGFSQCTVQRDENGKRVVHYGPPTQNGKTYKPSTEGGIALFDSSQNSPIVNSVPSAYAFGGPFLDQTIYADSTESLGYGKRIKISYGSIAPNSGIMFFYVAKVNEQSLPTVTSIYDENKGATFGAMLENLTYDMPFPTVNFTVGEPQPARQSLVNQGYVNNKDNNSGNFTLTGPRSSRVTPHGVLYRRSFESNDRVDGKLFNYSYDFEKKHLWSYANIFADYSKRISVSVDKEVIKNSGKDEDIDSRLIGDYTSDYDNYYFPYIPHDGIHRTVDGTVTWKVTVDNTGKNEGSNKVYDSIDCGLLIDTVDSPYELQEVYIPKVVYASEPYQEGGYNNKRDVMLFSGIRIQTPIGTEFPLIYDIHTKTVVGELPEDHAGIRISAEKVEDASVAWGFDAGTQEGSDQNTWATRYIIEFASYKSAERMLSPKLTVLRNGQFFEDSGKTLNAYLTFRTTDAIETNYNSFAVVLPNVQRDHLVITNDAIARTVSEIHKENGGAAPEINISEETSDSPEGGRLYAGRGKLLSTLKAGFGMPLLRAASPRWPSEQVSLEDKLAVEHSDWTDTSYTDGKKTITLVNSDGEAVIDEDGSPITVNSRTHGNMLLPEKAAGGDKIHGELMVESILYEAEHYDYFDKLKIYDLYGMEEDGRCAYNVDFDSIVVTDRKAGSSTKTAPSKEESDHDFELGRDYDIYYTTTDLVATEHHPITPVHTLEYAADIGALEANGIDWTKYDPDSEESRQAAHEAVGFKVVLRNDSGKVSKADGEQNYEIYVSYDATVRDDVRGDTRYPNVLAWSAIMHEEGTDVLKPFIEDTTAMFIETEESREPTITKILRSEVGYNIDTGKTFTFYVHHSKENKPGRDYTLRYLIKNDVDAVIRVDLRAGETKKIASEGVLVYNKGGYADTDAVLHGGGRFWIVEKVDEGYAATMPSQVDGSGIIPGDGQVYIGVGSQAGSFDSSKYEERYFTEAADQDTRAYFDGTVYNNLPYVSVAPESTNWYVKTTFTNTYKVGTLLLEKADSAGNLITTRPVTFELLKDSEPVTFRKATNNGMDVFYYYSGDPRESTDSLTTEITFTKNATLYSLQPGTYTLHEKVPPTGYGLADDQTIEVTAGMEKRTIRVMDPDSEHEVPGKLTIRKVNGDALITTGEAHFVIYPDMGSEPETEPAPLEFRKKTDDHGEVVPGIYIYDMDTTDSQYYSELVTEGGILELEEIPVGKYRIVETEAPKGYEAASTTYDDGVEAEVLRSTLTGNVNINNEIFSAQLRVTKLDETTGAPVTGAAAGFVVKATNSDADRNAGTETNDDAESGAEAAAVPLTFTKSTTGSYRFDEKGTETTLYTDPRTGILTITGLLKGEYSVEETEAPNGYALNAEPQAITINTSKPEEGDYYTLSFSDKVLPLTLRIHKEWKVQGIETRYDLEGVKFTVFQEDPGEGTTASYAAEGKTDAKGRLSIEGLDWKKDAWIVEELPEGYEPGDYVESLKLSADGRTLYLEGGDEALTSVNALYVPLSQGNFTTENDIPVYDKDVLNIRPNSFGGYYASVAYKTIDNYETAKRTGIPKQKGYSYYYTEDDYSSGNYNYVNAVSADDIVTYTLNIANVSSYEFLTPVIIDRMPETGDTGVVNHAERSSEFAVFNQGDLVVTLDGKKVDSALYSVSYSDKTVFTEDDFDAASSWSDTADASTKSFRVAFSDEFQFAPGSRLAVTYDGRIGGDAVPDEIAWNNFAYRYRVRRNDSRPVLKSLLPSMNNMINKAAREDNGVYVLTPEPPKVGVRIIPVEAEIKVKKSFVSTASNAEPEKFSFVLQNVSEADKGTVTYQTEDGSDADFPKDGISQEITVDAGGEKEFTFPKLSFSRSGIYEFDVTEATPADAEKVSEGIWRSGNVLYDVRPVHVTVDTTKIKASGEDRSVEYAEAVPVYQKTGEDAESSIAEFTNKYVSPGEVTFRGTKKIEGRDLKKDDVFTFTVEETTAGVSQPFRAEVKNKADGTIPYPTITYTVDDAGTHTYKVKETAKNEKGITCAENAYDVTVKVELDPDNGTLTVTPSDNYTALNFVNTYEAKGTVTFEGTKRFENEALKSGQFTFTVREGDAETGTVVATGSNAEAAAGEKAKITFTYAEDFGYTLDDVGKTYTYYLSEDIPEGAVKNANGDYEKDGVIYDSHSAKIIVSNITDKGDGTITAEVRYPDADNSFANRRPEKTSVNVKKVWRNATASTQPASVTIHLLADGKDTGKTLTLSEKNGWSGSFGGLDVKSDGKVIAYTVTEDAVSGYSVSIEKGSDGYSFTVTNTKNNDHHGGGGGGGGGRKPRIPETTPPAPEIPGSGITVPEVIGALPKTGAALGSLLGLIGILCACLFGFRKKKEDEDEEK